MQFISRTTLEEIKRIHRDCIKRTDHGEKCRNCIFQTEAELGGCVFSITPKWWRLDDINDMDIYEDMERGD